jgi:hypothetical protein
MIASNASDKREWYPLDPMVDLWPSSTLTFIADNPEEISLVADAKKICRPDFIIECRGQKDWFEKEGLGKLKLHNDSLKPILGIYIVSKDTVPEKAYKEFVSKQVSNESASEQEPKKQVANICILTVGFDQTKLEPIINKMTNQVDKIK